MGTGNQNRDNGGTQPLASCPVFADIADIAVHLPLSIGFWGCESVQTEYSK